MNKSRVIPDVEGQPMMHFGTRSDHVDARKRLIDKLVFSHSLEGKHQSHGLSLPAAIAFADRLGIVSDAHSRHVDTSGEMISRPLSSI